MNRIPQGFIDDLLNRLDIVEVIDHRVKLRKTGKNYSACCPFHDEKTPSFSVSPDKQFYYCFGCGASGNAVGFLMEYERQGFVDAVESLAKTAGVEVPKEQTKENREQHFRQKNLFDTLEKASTYYQQQLKDNPKRDQAIRYLQNRGLSGHIAKQFGMGYAPPGWDNLLIKYGLTEEDIALLVDSGLVIRRDDNNKLYDRFRHRIVFPIRDTRGRAIGFGGRVLDDSKPKYLNSPETDVFHKGRELYGLYEARQANRNLEQLLVVEGYMDVIALAQYGISNAVATLGTACGEDHLRLAFRYVQEVVFCFDGDNAGRKAAKRALLNSLPAMEDGRQIKFLFLAEGQDPDSLVRQIGDERFLQQVQAGIPLEDFLFDVAAEGIDIHTMDGRARFSKIAAPLLNQIPKGVYRELMFTNLAKRTGLSSSAIMELTAAKAELSDLKEEPVVEPTPSEAPPSEYHYDPSANAAPHVMDTADEQPTPDYEAEYGSLFQGEIAPPTSAPEARRRSSVTLNPITAATLLLLDNPQVLQKLSADSILEQQDTKDPALLRLFNLLDYLKKRPTANFSTLLGFWGGAYGIDSQQELAKMLATHELTSDVSLSSHQPHRVLRHAFDKIRKQFLITERDRELTELKAKGLSNLSDDEKNRFRELIKQ
ncbi:DNA primase [Teredinibacter franksiae]|jgi:DNA primase, catalytic core|uniref:DNA primase n=1 Tax=Teredinibacter franksiae TaxID=2761453 RepID=UPI0016273AF3|nr:DNA primase [Teredinibacter franksiae]